MRTGSEPVPQAVLLWFCADGPVAGAAKAGLGAAEPGPAIVRGPVPHRDPEPAEPLDREPGLVRGSEAGSGRSQNPPAAFPECGCYRDAAVVQQGAQRVKLNMFYLLSLKKFHKMI